jgi:hypothetical protein
VTLVEMPDQCAVLVKQDELYTYRTCIKTDEPHAFSPLHSITIDITYGTNCIIREEFFQALSQNENELAGCEKSSPQQGVPMLLLPLLSGGWVGFYDKGV